MCVETLPYVTDEELDNFEWKEARAFDDDEDEDDLEDEPNIFEDEDDLDDLEEDDDFEIDDDEFDDEDDEFEDDEDEDDPSFDLDNSRQPYNRLFEENEAVLIDRHLASMNRVRHARELY